MSVVLGALITYSGEGRALPSAAERAAAEALFDQALKAMESGQPDEACPKLEESHRLDPGVGTLLYLADCYRTIGRTASAWATFLQAAYAAKAEGQTDRQAIAAEQAEALKPKLTKLRISIATPAPAGLVVSNGGKQIGAPLWGSAIPVDPGEHTISAKADGKNSWSRTILVPDGPAVTEVQVPLLTELPAAPPVAAPLPPVPAVNSPQQSGPVALERSSASSTKTWGWVAIAGGGAALVGGGLFAVLAISDNGRADDHCRKSEPALCGERGVELGDSASGKAQLATIFSGAGAALAVTGVVLVLTAPSDSQQALILRPVLGRHAGGVRLLGTF